MNVKATLLRLINGNKTIIARTDLKAIFNYIRNLELEVSRLSRQKAVTIDITVED